MAAVALPLMPTLSLEVTLTSPAEVWPREWMLLLDDGKRYKLVERTPWRWELCETNGQSYTPERILEMGDANPGDRIWPRELHLNATIEGMRAAGGAWLAELLPWTPLLIMGSTCVDKDHTQREKVLQRRAILSVLFAALTSAEEPNQRHTRFHLHRMAYLSLADLYESATEQLHKEQVAIQLQRSLYAWQDEIVRDERGGFFAQGFPEVDPASSGPSCTASYRTCPAHAQQVRETALLDLLTTTPRAADPQPTALRKKDPQKTGQKAKDRQKENQERRLRTLFQQSPWGREVVRTLIRRWFLPRYDLDMAEQLKAAVDAAALESRQNETLDRGAKRDESRAAAVTTLEPHQNRPLGPWPILALLARRARCLAAGLALLYLVWARAAFGLQPALHAPVAQFLTLGIYLAGAGEVVHWIFGGQPDTSLPRLRAGMLLGVVGTLLQQQWDTLLSFAYTHNWAMLVVSAGLVLVSYQVLTAKIMAAMNWQSPERTQKGFGAWLQHWWGQQADTPHRRSRVFLGRAWISSFVFSLLLVDLLGGSYVVDPPAMQTNAWFALSLPGCVGHSYPSLVILFSGILLFAGIFGQLLWEEKPITEALA